MRNARKRRLKRKHGNHPAPPRQRFAVIKARPAKPIALQRAQRPLTLDEL